VIQRVRPAAYAWCETDDALLLVRIASSEREPRHWTLPGGGLEFGEPPEQGLLRELREETGFEGAVGALLGVRSAVLEPEETKSGDRLHLLGLLYRVSIIGGELRDETDDSTDRAAWIPFADLDSIDTVRVVRWARGIVGRQERT
jgi:8-oxo-dGTP diphosphatase